MSKKFKLDDDIITLSSDDEIQVSKNELPHKTSLKLIDEICKNQHEDTIPIKPVEIKAIKNSLGKNGIKMSNTTNHNHVEISQKDLKNDSFFKPSISIIPLDNKTEKTNMKIEDNLVVKEVNNTANGFSSLHEKITSPSKIPINNIEMFQKLLDFSRSLMKLSATEEALIINNMNKALGMAHPTYINSRDFRAQIISTRNEIEKNPKTIYIHLNHLMCLLKSFKKKKAASIADNNLNNNATSNIPKSETVTLIKNTSTNAQEILSIPCCSKSLMPQINMEKCQENSSPLDTIKTSSVGVGETGPSEIVLNDEEKNKYVRKLEKFLKKLDKKIKKLEEEELCLDDMDSEVSNYILEHKLKTKYIKVWEKLCEVDKSNIRVQRYIEDPFYYEGTRYKDINREIEKMINKKKIIQKFPDYVDVLNIVKQVNEEKGLGVNSVEDLAKVIFKEVGQELKERRQKDDKRLLSYYVPHGLASLWNEDPAEKDENLKTILVQNQKIGDRNINEILEHFVEKEAALKEEPKEVEEDSHSSVSDLENDKYEDDDLPDTEPTSPCKRSDNSACEIDDLPDTEPNSPNSGKNSIIKSSSPQLPSSTNKDSTLSSNCMEVIEIGSDSDIPTEPNTSPSKKLTDDEIEEFLNS